MYDVVSSLFSFDKNPFERTAATLYASVVLLAVMAYLYRCSQIICLIVQENQNRYSKTKIFVFWFICPSVSQKKLHGFWMRSPLRVKDEYTYVREWYI